MESITSFVNDKIEEHGSLENYKQSLYSPSWEERNAPVCEKHNYRGYLCQMCYEEKVRGIADLLRDCLYALNQIPNRRISGNYKDTYSLCSAIEKEINKT